MLTLKAAVAAALFIVTGGLLFAEAFKKNQVVRAIAALFAFVAFAFLGKELIAAFDQSRATPAAGEPTADAPSPPVEVNNPGNSSPPIIAKNAPSEEITQLAFSENGIILVSKGGRVHIWDVDKRIIKHNEMFRELENPLLSSDGKVLATIDPDAGVGELFNINGKAIRKFSFLKKTTGRDRIP